MQFISFQNKNNKKINNKQIDNNFIYEYFNLNNDEINFIQKNNAPEEINSSSETKKNKTKKSTKTIVV